MQNNLSSFLFRSTRDGFVTKRPPHSKLKNKNAKHIEIIALVITMVAI